MNKLCLKWWLSATLMVLSFSVFAQKYSIQLAAFTEQIEPTFFSFAGFQEVRHQQTPLNLHQYSWGNFATLAAAENQLNKFKQNPLLKEFSNLNILPSATHFETPTTDSNIEGETPTTGFQLFSRSVYIQSKSKSIQKIDAATLEEIATILKKQPTLKLRIIASENLTKQSVRTNSTDVVENFLLAQNIPAYRIKVILNPLVKGAAISKKQQVIMTLVDLKDEIVLDKFGNDGLMVKQINHHNHLQVID